MVSFDTLSSLNRMIQASKIPLGKLAIMDNFFGKMIDAVPLYTSQSLPHSRIFQPLSSLGVLLSSRITECRSLFLVQSNSTSKFRVAP